MFKSAINRNAMTTLNQIEQVMIMQMRALDSRVSVEAAKALNVLKLHLINQYHREQLKEHAERLIKPNSWQRIVFWFKVKQSNPQQSNN